MADSPSISPTSKSAPRPAPIAFPSQEQVSHCQLADFIAHVERTVGRTFETYRDFERFCLESNSTFWGEFIHWSGILRSGNSTPVMTGRTCEEAVFFPELNLNYSENVLSLAGETHAAQRPAIVAVHGDGSVAHWTRGELRAHTEDLARALASLGLQSTDRVALVAYNTPEAIAAALAAAALGCTVSTLAPELGPSAMLARLQQIEPAMLLTDLSPATGATGELQRTRVAEMAAELPSLRALMVLDASTPLPPLAIGVYRASALCAELSGTPMPVWPRLPFNHPLFVMFSSGTTGTPKCIVHGAGGTLLEHVKEHRLHCDLQPEDRLFFQTSTGWMMWNWQLSALAGGTALVLYDGPIQSADTLWRIVAKHDVSVFGTSPGYLQLCERAVEPATAGLGFAKLRAILSTGSILSPLQQDWVSRSVKALPVQSISGGTDIIGCFMLGNPLLPAYSAEPQCSSLGLQVQAVNPDGSPASGVGELVCANPFPSRPLGFLNDPAGARFHDAYFSQHVGLWTHGDLVEMTPQGSFRMHGRSDGVLNVRGIRIGPAEIYRILESVPEVSQAMALEQDHTASIGGSRLVLLVVLKPASTLDDTLEATIRRELAQQGSPAHVPSVLLAVSDLPTTWSGKLSERSARDVLNNREAINAEALRNPECLEPLRAFVRADSTATMAPTGPALHGAAESDGAMGIDEMIALWVGVLHRKGLSAQDNFFDLGGDSLAALDLTEAVSKRVGHTVPMTVIFDAPTIEEFTRIVNGQRQRNASLLVSLKEGSDANPLYIVHGYGGSVMELRPLVQALDTDLPVIGIRASGFEPGEPIYDRVEDMAGIYLAMLRKAQPHGPYRIAGYSAGGLIAFEMARRLVKEGEQVAPVLLIDTTVHQSHWSGSVWCEFLLRRSGHHLRRLFDGPGTGKRMLQLARSLRGHVKLAASGATPVDEIDDTNLSKEVKLLRSAGLRAYTYYAPTADKLPLVLIRSDLRFSTLADPVKIWGKLTPSLAVYDTPGDHLTMILSPHLTRLAETLSTVLQSTAALS